MWQIFTYLVCSVLPILEKLSKAVKNVIKFWGFMQNTFPKGTGSKQLETSVLVFNFVYKHSTLICISLKTVTGSLALPELMKTVN